MSRSKKDAAIRAEIRRIYASRVNISAAARSTAKAVLGRKAEANPTRRKNEYWCSACGGKFEDGASLCPHCGATLTYNRERCRLTFKSEHYLKEFLVYGKWQVVKEYVVDAKHRSGSEAEWSIYPVYSWWFHPRLGKVYVYARYLTMMPGWARIPFSQNSALRIMDIKSGNATPFWYSGWTETVVGKPKVLPYYADRGFGTDRYGKRGDEMLLTALTVHPTALETLSKLRHWQAVELFLTEARYRKVMTDCWRGIVVALRHGYDIGRIGWRLYLDYLKELKELKMDWHSPHYLCPKDFAEAHAATSRRLTRKMEERTRRIAEGRQRAVLERDIAERKRREEGAAEFTKRIARFLPLNIEGSGIIIRPLASVSEFLDEGTAMHHCVYSNAYYARPECLILSARTDEGRRLETVEVSLTNFTIIQSRAVCNGTSDRHDDILSLVTEAMPRIKELSKTTKYKQTA